MHPAGRRCSALPYARYARSSRRAGRLPPRDILIIGGGELALPLFEAGLVDRVGFNIHPVILGSGVPAFHPMTQQIDLELIDSRPIGDGCVYVDYRVVHA